MKKKSLELPISVHRLTTNLLFEFVIDFHRHDFDLLQTTFPYFKLFQKNVALFFQVQDVCLMVLFPLFPVTKFPAKLKIRRRNHGSENATPVRTGGVLKSLLRPRCAPFPFPACSDRGSATCSRWYIVLGTTWPPLH